MNPEQFTNASYELLSRSAQLATKHHNPSLLPLHTFMVGLDDQFCASYFTALNVPVSELRSIAEQEINALPSVTGAQLTLDYSMQQFIDKCQNEAQTMGDKYISLEHFLLQWATTPSLPESIKTFLRNHAFTHDAVRMLHATNTKRKNSER